MPGRVAVDAESAVLDGAGHPGRAEGQHLRLRAVDVLDPDVQMELLGAALVRELRRLVLRGVLEGQPPPRRVGQHRPG